MEPLFNFSAILPEAILLACACLILLVDLFVGARIRNFSYALTLVSLGLVAAFAWDPLSTGAVEYAFGGMYLIDPMTAVLKLAAILASALTLMYAQNYARKRDMWRGEFFSLTLFALLGIMTMISANNLLVIYLGLELQALSLYGMVALRRDDARATEAAMKYFVLGALASGFLLYGMSTVWHVHALRRHQHAGHQRAGPAHRDRADGAPGLGPGHDLHRRRDRLQARGGALPHVGTRRLSGRADAGGLVPGLGAQAGGLCHHLSPARGGLAAAGG
jgi:NADH-quinone oxidoreductase subunit N